MEGGLSEEHVKSFGFYEQHAEFVSSGNGTSPFEILHVLFSISITPLLTALLIPWIVPLNFIPMSFGETSTRNVVRALIEYPVIGILPLLTITVFAGHSTEGENQLSSCLPTVLVLSCIGIVIVNHSISRPTWASIWTQWTRIQDKVITTPFFQKKTASAKKTETQQIPFISTFRAMVVYVTVLSIIAVDFKIFPRRFAKTKVFGFSLMDVGTGSFIFANGIVSPEARQMKANFHQSVISSLPLFVLGVIRLITVKGTDYQEVVEEYGVHWNFFFTLAMVKILCAIVFRLIHPKQSVKLGFVIGLAYDAFLVYTGFQNDYLLNASISRHNSFIDANREGIFSAIGYTCIYCMSVYCGQLIYHGHGTTGRSRFRDWFNYAIVSGIQITFLWFLTFLTNYYWNRCSRRAGNFTYVLWSVVNNYTMLWFHLVFYLIQNLLQHMGLIYGPLLFHQLESSVKLSRAKKLKEELEASRCREEVKLKTEMDTDEGPSELELVALEGKLGLMEEKLKARQHTEETVTSGSVSQKELEELAEEMEKELKSVRKRSQGENAFGEAVKEMKKTGTNVAYLPDLTLTPITLSAISYNGLFVFLLGNLLTGLINLNVVSMYTPPAIALVILWSYATVVIGISLILYFYRIQLKFW